MKKINLNKVFTEYRDQILPTSPIKDRKYTITHSDETGDLFVTIGLKYAEDQITPIRDEVKLNWRIYNKKLFLYGEVLVDGAHLKGNEIIRNAIFIKEMPTALQAARYADQALFEKYPQLDHIPIYIQFYSKRPEFNKLRYFGTMKRYRH